MRSLWYALRGNCLKTKEKFFLLQVTVSGEGKSVIARNLALTAASNGKKVLLMTGFSQKRKSSPHGDVHDHGLSDVISGKTALEKAIFRDKESGVYTMAAGRVSGRIIRLLGSKTMGTIFTTCKKTMDLIIIDAPPCDLFSDASVLADHADSILYILAMISFRSAAS